MGSQIDLNLPDGPVMETKPVVDQCPFLPDNFRIQAAHTGHNEAESCGNPEEEDRRTTAAAFKKEKLIDFLGPLEGDFKGPGYNIIFRPMNKKTPTPEFEGKKLDGNQFEDNVLELNFTQEHWTFTRNLGAVPNRGLFEQGDIDLHGISYVQRVADVAENIIKKPGACPAGKGIHFEPGLFMFVPATQNPSIGPTISRMASIPHGTTINLQGLAPKASEKNKGPPKFDSVTITPFPIGGKPSTKSKKFESQTVEKNNTPRLPQNLEPFVKAKVINDTIMGDPNEVLRKANEGKHIRDHFSFSLTSQPFAGIVGGGVNNIPFLEGGNQGPTAKVAKVESTFWISTVLYEVELPVFKPCGEGDCKDLKPISKDGEEDVHAPTFRLSWEVKVPEIRSVSVTQVQYSQTVLLDFATLSWPHVSVATLLPTQVSLVEDKSS